MIYYTIDYHTGAGYIAIHHTKIDGHRELNEETEISVVDPVVYSVYIDLKSITADLEHPTMKVLIANKSFMKLITECRRVYIFSPSLSYYPRDSLLEDSYLATNYSWQLMELLIDSTFVSMSRYPQISKLIENGRKAKAMHIKKITEMTLAGLKASV